MEVKKPTFIVTEHPNWYSKLKYKDVFNCESTQELFNTVADLMVCKQDELSEREKRYKPKNIYKSIRDMVLQDAEAIQQKPSVLLLRALMDLVDIQGGNDFDSIASVDKAGIKHLLLGCGKYTAFYIPNKELVSPNGKKVIPVVTQYSETHNLIFYDSSRSMIGTYIVEMPKTGKANGNSYFLQEVLFVPGLESLELLKGVTGNKFEFWDMALEVPTHLTALIPCFQEIQPSQLLRTEDKNPCTQSNNEAVVSHMDEIHPMCCVVETAEMLKNKREGSVDCLTETQVRCDLTHFHYTNSGTRTVYYRRNGKSLDGKKVNLVPVATLREGQVEKPELYVSTTVRFCRAVKQCFVKGYGELASSCCATIQELNRKTFIVGPLMYQVILNSALTAFIKCVNPNSWCNFIPRHIETMIKDPVMVEVVELAIKFMGSKIPNAFAVAELLYCPIENVREYLRFWNMYASDSAIHTAVKKKHISIVEEQMTKDWADLAQIASSYGQRRYNGDAKMVSACKALYTDQTLDNAAKASEMWHALIKHDTSQIKDKNLVQMYANAKVLFLKLHAHHNKVKKGLKLRVGEHGDPQSGPYSSSSTSSRSTAADDADVSSKCPAEVEECNKDRAMTGISERGDSLYSIVIPESVPISTWIKNMSTLLMSEPWLNNEPLRREAVCTLLALDNTLLDSRHSDILQDWVINNQTVVNVLHMYGLQDRLSKALVDCLASMSTVNWKRKILMSFHGTPVQSMGHSDQLVTKLYNKRNPSAQCNKSGLHDKRRGPEKQAPLQHPKVVKQDRTSSKSNKHSTSKSSGSKSDKKARNSQAHSSRTRYEDQHPWLCKAVEVTSGEEECDEEDEDEIPGEDLEATMGCDNSESPDEYEYSDEFIDVRPTEKECSSEGEEEDVEAFSRAELKGGRKRLSVRGRMLIESISVCHIQSPKKTTAPSLAVVVI
ncbi:uncharacterized protein LOC122884086 [Siniperca chuatsi]|uniref:uncharacterized protein LOC122884086 n=1 Tax=Siniperca chuatsi TaxID=119488 RepID=UPI001CE18EA9|nr:uncharacterized protein LOC122884086 [Siniperca chuatsi]XP_044069419.1 uncharacterized protein LOC122884086 [Siniperca chuatsi]